MYIQLPDLKFTEAVGFVKDLDGITPDPEKTDNINFDKISNCDPFPMLLISSAIRQKFQQKIIGKKCRGAFNKGRCTGYGYAKYMRFFSACGFSSLGDDVGFDRGKDTYRCITRLSVPDLREEGIANCDVLQEVIQKKSRGIATVLAQGEKNLENWLTYAITEMIRNIPEHSESDQIWYAAQYWPSKDLVEVAILDEGIGIKQSFLNNPYYRDMVTSNEVALKMALEPGKTDSYLQRVPLWRTGEWKNSGFGLYVVSQMCLEMGGSFVIASGDHALCLETDEQGKKIETFIPTVVNGTAIRLRIKPSLKVDYNKLREKVVAEGEAIAENSEQSVKSASKASRGFTYYD